MASAWTDLVTVKEVREAASRIEGVALRTPLLPFPDLSEKLGGEVRLKCESLQKTGSFKMRGALNFLSRLTKGELGRGVITYSSGNHAQALAFAAGQSGVRAVAVMPTNAAQVKIDGARSLGAEVVLEGTTSIQRKTRAEAIADEEGLTVVPPFEHPFIIAGQGTVGLEIAQEWPEVDLVLAPIGGGGLISGIAVAVKALLPEVTVLGVEAKGAPTMHAALEAGGPVTLDGTDTIADGLKPVRVGDLTFLHAEALLDGVVLVEDDAILDATGLLLHDRKLVVEVSGAAVVGALLSHPNLTSGRRVAAVLSGGNLDRSILGRLSGGPG
ncbi:MAG: pyridoxal-phosphate dependent enzyme [Gemmatimonadetes bacterium]|nr:pyridoxal-phosphate dependent enzyme [Gemmatimonadota bacterium]NNM04097.1 pyridoxal-phosphate dependent enzyme [Gemmatimonadota bacterium]